VHISDGILSVPVITAGFGVTVIGTIYGLRHLRYEDIPRAAFISSVFFTASLIHVPAGLSSAHLILNGLVGLLAGFSAFPVILTGLVLQAFFFSWGGITTLGVNTMDMALPALLCGLLFRRWLCASVASPLKTAAIGFSAGAGAVFFSALMTAFMLYLSNGTHLTAAKIIFTAHLPVIFAEGLITASICLFLRKVKPDLLKMEMEK